MSTPFTGHENAIQGAISEVMSAMSALNMEAEPIKPDEGAVDRSIASRPYYLSETDAWAKHAMEHLGAVYQLLRRAAAEEAKQRDEAVALRGRLTDLTNALERLAGSAEGLGMYARTLQDVLKTKP